MSRQSACALRITCKECRHFIGVITPDGKGPIMDECYGSGPGALVAQIKPGKCRMLDSMQQFQPPRSKKYRIGTTGGKLDSDSGGYQSIAIRAMEDGG